MNDRPTDPYTSSISRVADTVLDVDSFAGKRHQTLPEFEAFAGILYIKALQHPHALAPARGPSNKMGIKVRERKRGGPSLLRGGVIADTND